MTCSVESCERAANGGRGWCKAHYMRWFQKGDVLANVPLRQRGGDPELRFWPKVRKDGPSPMGHPELGACWIYTGHTDRNGYGLFRLDGTHVGAHCFAFKASGGQVPDEFELDHLCRNRACVNPEHLEPVTHAENMRRAYAGQTQCKYGHPLDDDNLWHTKTGGRVCKECSRRRVREHMRRKRAANT